jgi:imidazolonepropionase-like amidohydrolase
VVRHAIPQVESSTNIAIPKAAAQTSNCKLSLSKSLAMNAKCPALLILAIAAVTPLSASQNPPLTLRYSIVSNGTTAGSEVDTYSAGGKVDSAYEFNDRGRGPKIAAHYALAPDGTLLRADLTGVDYLKAPVDEHFAVEGGKAHWNSTSEHGEASASGFYVSINGVGAESAFLVAALVKAKNAGVKLFPSGEAHLDRLLDTTIESHGQKMHVVEYAVTGLSFAPAPVWVDDEGHFFASPGKWFAFLREGWEDTNDKLYDLQLKAENARLERLAHDLAQHPAQPIVIEHVRVFDSENAVTREDQTVVVDGDRIVSAGPAASTTLPQNAKHIDGRGKTLLPGLFDMHVHVSALDGLLHIASGVTSVRDMGNDIDEIHRVQNQWDNGSAIGPHLWKAGFIDGRGPFQAPTGLYADTQEEALAAVNRYADLGYVQIKLYSSLNPEFIPAIAKAAHARGLRLSGHVPNGITASQFVNDGADELQHINFIFLNFFADKVKDTRTPERFTAVGANAASLDLQSKPVNDFIQLLLDHHTTVDVTLAAFEGMFTGRPGQVSPDFAPVLSRLPAQVQRSAYTGGLPVDNTNDQLYKNSYKAMLSMTRRMYDAGVPILVGTDAIPGIMLHRELELEVEAGIPPAKALQNATIVAARVLKQDGSRGPIVAGKKADLVMVEGNPLEHISDIRRERLVVKDGVMFDCAAVYQAVGIAPSR